MDYTELVRESIGNLSKPLFEEAKNTIVDGYIKLSIMKKEEITPSVLSEKVCDYIEKVLIQNGTPFEQLLKEYYSVFDSIVKGKIKSLAGSDGKGKKTRAGKYYDKACTIRKGPLTIQNLMDYTRIMMCLYMRIIETKKDYPIENFNYSSECLHLPEMLDSLRSEEADRIKNLKDEAIRWIRNSYREDLRTDYKAAWSKNQFSTDNPFSRDNCILVIMILLYCCIKSKEVTGEF